MIKNGYATLDQYRDYGIANQEADITDDAVIERLINAVSRYIDKKTGRTFYPRVATKYYSVPDPGSPQLWVNDDLLEIISLTNGNDDAIVAASYNLLPRNYYPKYAVRLISTSNIYWQRDSNANDEYVIDLEGVWGYREYYDTEALESITTLNEGALLTAADTTLTLTSTTDINSNGGQIIRIEDELMHVKGRSGSNITVERGANGSTAATHVDGSTVQLWHYPEEIIEACCQSVNGVYKRRTGENVTASSIITSGGIMITPKDIPDFAADIIHKNTRVI